jgi:hypothetical protein
VALAVADQVEVHVLRVCPVSAQVQ